MSNCIMGCYYCVSYNKKTKELTKQICSLIHIHVPYESGTCSTSGIIQQEFFRGAESAKAGYLYGIIPTE
ncbi:hypothetical protein K1719_028369 [Acacia pycnantha]|nr:hypothetical protein K1719_028369 [Acacia pycnantha]